MTSDGDAEFDDAELDDVDPAPTAATAHLDRPLARTLTFDALTTRPTGAQVARLQRDVEGGRYGEDQIGAVARSGVSPGRVGLIVGGAGAVVGVIVVMVALVQGDAALAGFSAVAMGVFAVGTGAATFLVGTLLRRRRWRRHTQVALFAEANGLEFRPVPGADRVPRHVRRKPRRADEPVHTDLVTGRVQGRPVQMGYRAVAVERHDGTSETRRLQWVALRRAPSPDVEHPGWLTFEERCRALLPTSELRVHRDQKWVVVGVEGGWGSPAAFKDLCEMIDVALELDER